MALSNKDIRNTIAVIQELYLMDNIPWICGYSGGKDSTAIVQLVWQALNELPQNKQRHKVVHIISTDTLVEQPIVSLWAKQSLSKMEKQAIEQNINIVPHMLKPKIENTFWVNLIGRGYPYPRTNFRWCTDRLKIEPSNSFIKEVLNAENEAILVLGSRKAESVARRSVMEDYEKKRYREHLSPNGSFPNSYIFTPIEDWSNDDVWQYLMQHDNPWGHSNKELLAMYSGASADGECPLVLDNSTPSCGNSRFGCWICTMVSEDKSMDAMIRNDEEKAWMIPLLEFRNYIACSDKDSLKEFLNEIEDKESLEMFLTELNEEGHLHEFLDVFNKSHLEKKIIKIIKAKKQPKIDCLNEIYQSIKENMSYLHKLDEKIKRKIRDKIERPRRDFRRMNGKLTYHKSKDRLVHGPYTKTVRENLLKRLLIIEKTIKRICPSELQANNLVTMDELKYIRKLWLDEKHEFDDSLPVIYEEITGNKFNDDSITYNKYYGKDEWDMIHQICAELYPEEKLLPELQCSLLDIEAKASAMSKRRNIMIDIERQFKRTYYKNEEQALILERQRIVDLGLDGIDIEPNEGDI